MKRRKYQYSQLESLMMERAAAESAIKHMEKYGYDAGPMRGHILNLTSLIEDIKNEMRLQNAKSIDVTK